MSRNALQYRERAAWCRKLAETARTPGTGDQLIQMANDFDAEARLLDEAEKADGTEGVA